MATPIMFASGGVLRGRKDKGIAIELLLRGHGRKRELIQYEE